MCTGLKKCIPTTRSGLRAPRASSVIESEEVFEAKTNGPRATASTSRRMLALDVYNFRRGLYEEVGGGRFRQLDGPADALERLVAVLLGQLGALDALLQVALDCPNPARQRLAVHVAQDDL